MAVSEAQKRANQKWKEKNKEKAVVIRGRAAAKHFVRNGAELADMKMLLESFQEVHTECNLSAVLSELQKLIDSTKE